MDVRFLGHAAFELSDGDTSVLIDPFLTGNPKAAAKPDELNPTTILLTHGHPDHVGDTVDIAKRSGAPVLAITELAGELEGDGLEVVNCNLGGSHAFDWGWAKLVPAWHTSTTPKGTVNTPAGLLVNFKDTLVYHLGDTALFSDLKLVGKRRHIDVALMCIGGHFTMDRHDAVDAADFVGAKTVIPCHYNTFPLDRDRRPGVQGRCRVGHELDGDGPGAGRHLHAMTHAIVLIQAEGSALATLGGELAGIEGVAEAYSVTGDWDFVAILRLREQEMLAQVVTGKLSQLSGVRRTQTMVAFEVYSRHDLEALVLRRSVTVSAAPEGVGRNDLAARDAS